MSIMQLPSKMWRAQVYDAATGKNIPVADVIGGPRSFKTKRDAKAAREKARAKLLKQNRNGVTVAAFRERWLTDKLFATPKESTRIHYRERTRAFADRYGDVQIELIDDDVVAEWLASGMASTVPALRAMFNDAAHVKAGRVVKHNPFNKLGLEKSKGNKEKDPPAEDVVWSLIAAAREKSGPYFAAWLQVAAFTGMRPGELDALKWNRIDFGSGLIAVDEQFNNKSKTFTLPKNGLRRKAILTPHARAALVELPRVSEFCFVNTQGNHFTHKSRARHWDKARGAVGFKDTLYLATRHFAGAYMVNVLGLDSEDVAFALGHEDGGELVRQLYGHRDRKLALDRVAAAYAGRSNVTPLRPAGQTAHATAHEMANAL